MQVDWDLRLAAGARNLLLNCAECQPGQTLLVVHETEDDGYYDPRLGPLIDTAAAQMGLQIEHHGVPLAPDVHDPDQDLADKMRAADCTLFLARLGDQIRFRKKDAARNQIISYALDPEMLASSFGTAHYGAFERLKHLVNQMMIQAQDIHVTCPAGTDFRGGQVQFGEGGGDVTRKRFPVSVFTPIPAATFRGRVAQQGFLTGTGSHYYAPWSCEIADTLMVEFEGNRITGFNGSEQDVARAHAHYKFVGEKYGIDTFHVHSWHAGIHPGCAYTGSAGKHMERWSGSAFGNPRLLHFHTCGDYPPGEISINVLDPTVWIDGVAVWEDGRLYPERIPGADILLETYPCMADAFLHPAYQVGQDDCGRLSLR